MQRDGNEPGWQRGRMIGDRYQIDRLIGQGGMGVVYSVLDRKLNGIRRALKVVKGAGAGSGLYDEAAMLMRLNHPHLPVIFDYFRLEEQGEEAFVMDFIEGRTLSELLDDPLSAFTFDELVRIGSQLCSALAYLHDQPRPIIHRDLKPSNIMIDYSGNVKVIDFGISRTFKAGQLQDTMRLGTLQFAAPEQLAMKQSDERTDIYGLGMLLFYVASGGGIYSSQQPQSIRKLLAGRLPVPFIVILERMLQMNPSYRYASMVEVERAMKSFINNSRGCTASDIQALPLAGMRQRMLVSVISLHAGAGATFLTPLIAELLQDQKTTKAVTAIEHPRLVPEWRQSLHEGIQWNVVETGSIKDQQQYLHGYEVGRSIHWYAVNNEDAAVGQRDPGEELEDLLRHSGESITLIDLSNNWEQADSYYWLTKSRYVIVVADPFVAKWQTGKMRKLELLAEELKHKGMELVWIANKDVRFNCRHDWLRLFPKRPVATIPLLPNDALLNIMWSGKRIMDDPSVSKQLSGALKPIIALLANENNANSR